MDGLFGDGLVDVLCCGGDSLEEEAKCVSVCLVLCVCRGSKYSEVVPDWLILNSDLYGTIHDCGPLRTQFDDVVVLAVVFFALFSRSIGFQIFGNLKDIPLI